MSESILYYPTINIQDSAWLRSAALYWDEVCSIVPYEDYADISPELLYLQERGYYRPIYPQDIFVRGDSYEFSDAVKHHFSSMLRPRRHFLARTHTCKPPKRRKIYSPSITSLIHYNKIPPEIIRLFTDSDMVVIKDDWLEMDEVFANCYMRLLAEFVVKYDEKSMVLGSAKAESICEMYPQFFRRKINCEAVSLTLEKCLPIPAADVGFEYLLDFKEEYKEELLSLQIKISELESKISKAENVEEIKREIVAFRKAWELELIRTEKILKGHGIQYTFGSLRSFIQDAGAIAGLAQWSERLMPHLPVTALGVPIGMGGLIGVGACAMNYRNRIRSETNASGFAYIVSANKAGLLSNTKNTIEIL